MEQIGPDALRCQKALVIHPDRHSGRIPAGRQSAAGWGRRVQSAARSRVAATMSAQQLPQRSAGKTGARLYRADTQRDLTQSFAYIAEELRRQYSLGYYPQNMAQAGQRRQIKVRVMRPDLAVRRTRQLYLNPANGGTVANQADPAPQRSPSRRRCASDNSTKRGSMTGTMNEKQLVFHSSFRVPRSSLNYCAIRDGGVLGTMMSGRVCSSYRLGRRRVRRRFRSEAHALADAAFLSIIARRIIVFSPMPIAGCATHLDAHVLYG